MLDRTFNMQRVAPTEKGATEHAYFRSIVPNYVGTVAVQTSNGDTIGLAEVGDGDYEARLIVMRDGISPSGSETFTPTMMVIPEVVAGKHIA